MKICNVEGCGRTLYAESVCRLHYDRLRRRGTVADPAPKVAAECEIEGCVKPVHSKGLCQPHYRKMQRNGDPLKVVPVGRPHVEGSTDHRKLPSEILEVRAIARKLRYEDRVECPNGHELTPENTYVYPEGHKSAGQKVCKICRRDSQRKYHGLEPIPADVPLGTRNRDKTHCPQNHEYTKANTGYTQDGSRVCLTCGRDNMRRYTYGISPEVFAEMIVEQNNKCWICHEDFGETTPHVDHCHVSGSVRALLCAECNHGLGNFHDNPEFLLRAVAYLQKFGYEVIED